LEHSTLALPIEPVGGRDDVAAPAHDGGPGGEIFIDRQEPLAVRVRKRPKQELIDDREDRGVAADTKCQREHDRDREPRASPEAASHMSDIPHDVFDEAGTPDVVAVFLGPEHVLTRHRFDVESHFLIHVAISGTPGEKCDH
jgi:hypothetical protein